MENINQASPDKTASASGPGKLLHQARKDLRLAPEDVAQILHLSSKQIIALEQDDYKNLPGPTYVRGYLRSYAQLLGLSADKVLDSYNGLTLPSRPISLPQSAPPPQITSDHRLVKAATLGVTAMVLGMVYLWWRSPAEAPPSPPSPAVSQAPVPLTPPGVTENLTVPPSAGVSAPVNSVHAPVANETAPESVGGNPARNPGGPAAPSAKPAASNGPLTASGMVLNVSPTESVRPETTTTRTDRAMRVRRAAEAPSGVTRSRLVLHATQESWADIRDASDNKLLYENVPAGRSIAIEGVAPFSVFLGNADGVRVEFNGRDFDISRYKRGQVARFTLGEEKAVNN